MKNTPEKIVGYFLKEAGFICSECITNEEKEEANVDLILTEKHLKKLIEDGQIFYCKRCGKWF
jgi:hypothetical protein